LNPTFEPVIARSGSDAAFAKIFRTIEFMAHLLGDARLHTIAASRCR
jgi:hypothetical protein